MPSKSRRVLPKLSIFSRHSASPTTTSAVFSPSSASSSNTTQHPPPSTPVLAPLTPPARLHLRNILPTSPDALPTPPPPPRQPYPWLWQCHACQTVYRLACTRRCLLCSHEYCVSARPPPSTSKRGRKRRRAAPRGMCASEFDYAGWAEWGAWRRKVLGLQGEDQGRRDQAFVDRVHSCAQDCDYPSECHHERYRLASEARQRDRMLETLVEEESEPEPEPVSPTFVPSGAAQRRRSRSPDDDELPLNEALELREVADDGGDGERSPTSPLRQSSFFWDEPEEKEKRERAGEKDWWADLDAAAAAEQTRKAKSLKKIQQLTGVERSGPFVPGGSPAVDAGGMDAATLYALIEEDAHMMPVDANAAAEQDTRFSGRDDSSGGGGGDGGKLTVRNRTDAEIWDDWESSDSDSDSDDSSSSSDDDDDEWFPAHELTPGFEVHGMSTRSHSREDADRNRDRDLRAFAFLREEIR
ncbi:hypothetical protein F4779DRAFT_500247 [Xylariaceae sp. FL0662B]|nr:hypothetical protein F4779DRAFT_500247 [Xylariaceae sp. FL0662B]